MCHDERRRLSDTFHTAPTGVRLGVHSALGLPLKLTRAQINLSLCSHSPFTGKCESRYVPDSAKNSRYVPDFVKKPQYVPDQVPICSRSRIAGNISGIVPNMFPIKSRYVPDQVPICSRFFISPAPKTSMIVRPRRSFSNALMA